MLLTNLTASEYYVGAKAYLLPANGTLTIPDTVYNVDDSVALAANALVAAGKASASSTPTPFPRGGTTSTSVLPDTAGKTVGQALVLDASLNPSWGAAVSASSRFSIKLVADDTAVAVGDGKFIFSVPSDLNGKNLTSVRLYVTTVSSSGLPTVQLRNITDAVDMLSTRVTIDVSEFDSGTAAAAAVIDLAHDDVATGDQIAVDIDVAGTGTKGLGIDLVFA